MLTEESREANFTNEGGVDGKIRYLRNVMGMWLLSESIRTWERAGQSVELTPLLNQAAEISTPVPIFDANHPSLLAPGDMPKRIAALCAEAGAAVPQSPAEFARSIVESLAEAYATAIDDAERLSGSKINTVHVVGGGSQNTLLCQLTANRTGRRVLAGPVEATAVGNVLIQGRAAGLVRESSTNCGSWSPGPFRQWSTSRRACGSEAEVITVSLPGGTLASANRGREDTKRASAVMAA